MLLGPTIAKTNL